MFEIQRQLAGQSNAPEMLIDLPYGSSSSVTFKRGTAVRLSSGVVTKCSGDVTPEYIVAADVSVSAATDIIKVYKILPTMVFKTKLSAYSSTYNKVGKFVTFASDGLRVTATAASGFTNEGTVASTTATIVPGPLGALIVDTCGAKAAGDEVLVMMGRGI